MVGPRSRQAYGLVPVAVLAPAGSPQAGHDITSERDGGALDVLLVTDVSPKEFVFGKLLGVLYNCKEYIVPPFLLAVFYAVRGALGYASPRTLARRGVRREHRPARRGFGALAVNVRLRGDVGASSCRCESRKAGLPSRTRSARSSSSPSAR